MYGFFFLDATTLSIVALCRGSDLIRRWTVSSRTGRVNFLFFLMALDSTLSQSACIITTVAGQAVSEGFLRWRVSVRFHPGSKTYCQSHLPVQPVARRLMTRLLAIIPSTIVAVVGGRTGIDVLLVASQVVLSIVLPFVVVPLIYLTSSKSIMSVRRPRKSTLPEEAATPQELESAAEYEMVDFRSGKVVTAIGSFICLMITLANVYVIVSLGINS